jgi:Protein of unknown function (DUF1553)/Protein of unknown function (DUF1549)
LRWTPALLLILFAVPAMADPPHAGERHWSFRPRSRPDLPQFSGPGDRDWVRNAIDAFVLQRLRAEGLRPAVEADRRTLIRRLCFDLIGLPPTPEEVAGFVNDSAPDAYERLVDRLLASPGYGEQWGRHWLDVVRYAETEGFEYDREHPGAWRYRDYVIRSFAEDRPFDRFVREQLAGDEIAPDDRDSLVAAGFHRLGPVRRNAGNPELAFSRNEVLTEMTDAVGAVFLGLTVGCARCHDHKFDDFPQEDYYRLEAFLAAAQEHDVVLATAAAQSEWKARNEKIQREIKKVKDSLRGLKRDELDRARVRLRELTESLPPPLPMIHSVRDVEKERTPIHVLKRGDPDRKGQQVGPRAPGALVSPGTAELAPEAPHPREMLARWITEPEHPLTARVLVNRVWQYHFGRGLVATANDFGVNGAPPSHPELLDFLANDFVAGGWRLKPLHRMILLSSTYRQASRVTASDDGLRKDPDDRLLWHFPRRRLEAEEVRDAMLTVSGDFNPRAGGPSVVLPIDGDLVNLLYDPAQWTVTADEREHRRRSVYLLARRNLRLPFAESFDQPDRLISCPRRESSTHALQALELLNGKTSNQLAEVFAARLEREAGANASARIDLAYRLTAGRTPTTKERELAMKFLTRQPLREFALVMFNLNAFLYVD